MKILSIPVRRCISYSMVFFTVFFAVVTQAQAKQEAGRFYGLTGESACFNLNKKPLVGKSFKGVFYDGDVVTYAAGADDGVTIETEKGTENINCRSAVLIVRRDGMEPLDYKVSKKNEEQSLSLNILSQEPSSRWVRTTEEFWNFFKGVTGLVDAKTKGNPNWECSNLVKVPQYLPISTEPDIYIWSGTEKCPGFSFTSTTSKTISGLSDCGQRDSSDGVPIDGTKEGNWLQLNLSKIVMEVGKCYLLQVGNKKVKIRAVSSTGAEENSNTQSLPYGVFELENHQQLKKNFPDLK